MTNHGADPSLGLIALSSNEGSDEYASNPGPPQNQAGVMLVDVDGHLVWFRPRQRPTRNLQVQTYRGEPVLTWWEGHDITRGIGRGAFMVVDQSYRQVTQIEAGHGLSTDFHDMVITPNDTALVIAYATKETDLSSVGGRQDGRVFDGVVQEIDVATGEVLFEWRASDHVPIDESYQKPVKDPFDWFHLNSVAIDTDGDLLVSARYTSCVYKIDRTSGAVRWRLGGKHSDYRMADGARFAWQHHARRHDDGTISIFDNAAAHEAAPEQHSRGIVLDLDDTTRTATLRRQVTHPAALLAESQGSVQPLTGGDMFVGWGSEPYFSEFSPGGDVVLDGVLPTNDHSYRALRHPWSAQPTDRPAVTVEPDNSGDHTVYVSWNGATDVTRWRAVVTTNGTFVPVASVATHGFETQFTVRTDRDRLAVEALNSEGKVLGRSRVTELG